jgi:tetratricopeptide (TPR) repeat protein
LDNVLIDPEGGARLTDFGQSRSLENQYVSTVGVGGILYLAPEIFGRNDAKGTRFVQSDIYAFGVVAYRMLCGRFPHRNYQEIINRIPFPRPRHINPSVPEELDKIIWKCLEKRPADRYRTGSELLAAFESLEQKLAEAKVAPVPVPLPEALGRRTPAEELAAIAGEKLDRGLENEVVDTLEVAIRHMSTSPKLLLIYAEAAKRLKKYELAHEVYVRVIRWVEVNGWSDDDQREAYEGLAEVCVRLKRYEAAVKAFFWLYERWPEKRWYCYRLGVAYGLAGRYEKSIDLLLPLNESEPAALVCGKIGFAYYQNRQIDLACQFFNEALMMDAFEPTALFHLAQIRAYQGQMQRAEELLSRLRKIEDAEEMVDHLESLLGKGSLAKAT